MKTNIKSVLLILGIVLTLNFSAVNKTANGLFANWNNPATWTPSGVPTSTDDVIINGAIIQSGNVQVNFISINNNGGIINSGTISLTGSMINHGTYIDNGTTQFNGVDQAVTGTQITTFNNFILNSTGDFSPNVPIRVNNLLSLLSGTMNSNANLTLVNDGTNNGRVGKVVAGNITGIFTAQKWVTKCDGAWSDLGSCMDTQLQDLDLYYTGFPGGAFYPSFTFINTYYYDESSAGPATNGYYAPVSTTAINPRGKGFSYWYQNFSAPSDFPRIMPMTGTLDFLTHFDFGVTFSNSSSPDDGLNFIANPFPGTIDWDAPAGWTKTNMDNVTYVWDNCAGLYATHAGNVNVNGGSRYISEGQGFWVQATAASPSLACDGQVISSVNQALLKTSSAVPSVAYITFNGDEIAVRLDANGTNGVDSQLDATKLYSDSAKIASCAGTNTTTTYGINTVFNAPVVTVPLLTRRSGMLTFQNISSFTGYTVKLNDKGTNAIYGLSDNYNYWFNESDTTYKNRFDLIFTTTAGPTGIESYVKSNVEIYPNPANENVSILNDVENYSVVVTNVLGQKIKTISATEKKTEINTADLPAGAYQFNVISKNGISQNKVLISH